MLKSLYLLYIGKTEYFIYDRGAIQHQYFSAKGTAQVLPFKKGLVAEGVRRKATWAVEIRFDRLSQLRSAIITVKAVFYCDFAYILTLGILIGCFFMAYK